MITQKHVQQYRQEGYTICDQLLPPAELGPMADYLDQFIAEQGKAGRRPEHLDKPHVWDYRIRQMCSHPLILDAIEQFIGPNIVLFSSHIISKAKGDGLAVPWHQAGNYWPLEPMNVVTLWLAIDDSTLVNGCMKVIPHTQDTGPIEHVKDEHPETKVLHEALPGHLIDESKAVNCVLQRGGASFHAPWLFHGSQPNTSTKRRCGFTMRFMPAETHMLRTGPLAKWFAEHPLFLLRGSDPRRNNVYANA